MFGRKKKEGTRAFRRDMARKLDGRKLKYVTERFGDGTESVVGREGALILKDGELLVYSSEQVVMRCDTDTMTASELLSMEGVIITAGDKEHGGGTRCIVAYYTYYM